MDTRGSQYIDNLLAKVGELPVLSPTDLSKVLPLYMKVYGNNGVVNNVSFAYISTYDGKTVYRKFKAKFDRMYEMFLKNALTPESRHAILRSVAKRVHKLPVTMKDMDYLFRVVVEESNAHIRSRRLMEARKALVSRFSSAVKKYLKMTFDLGFNEPSACVKHLAQTHKIDKYIMSGDFPVILLPFLPEVEETIRSSYENYGMADAWELLKGRYFDHKGQYMALAVEIKSTFNRRISNFSDYLDGIYTDTYYNLMLGKKKKKRIQ